MTLISSRMTFFYKRIFPAIFFGFAALVAIVGPLAGWRTGQIPPAPFFIMPIVVIVFSYFLFRKLVFDLVDEVWDAGDSLLVRNGSSEAKIPLGTIKNVNYTVL